MDERVRTVVRMMEKQIECRLTAPTLAGAVGLSVTQLNRLFRVETGRTIQAFLHDLRMARALILVEQTSLSIAEVMRRVGITDRSHFARDFRRAYGVCPRTMRMDLRVFDPQSSR